MLTKRIIPCLDVNKGRVVKGVNFVNLRDAGDPVELARQYDLQGADELVFLDITASEEKRKLMADLAGQVARELFIPFTIGGAISVADDMKAILNQGADKVAVNTAAVQRPELIEEGAGLFGSQCIVLAMDVKQVRPGDWRVFIYGGKKETDLEAVEWAEKAVGLGAGEILLTSMDCDGTLAGYDLEITRAISRAVPVPVIASGGGGKPEHFRDAVTLGEADGVLAASVFHDNKIPIPQLKRYLEGQQIPVRRTYGD